MATGDLVDLTFVKRMLGLALDQNTHDDLLGSLITSASAWVKGYCKRTFLADTFREFVNGTGQDRMWLKEWPIQNIYSIREGDVDAIQLQYVGTDAHWASVEVVSDMRLTLRTSVAGTITPTDLAFSTYTTLTTLVAAINAVSGWTATAVTTVADAQESKELLPFQGNDTLSAYVTLQTTDSLIGNWTVEADWGELIRPDSTWSKGIRNFVVRHVSGYGTAGSATSADLPMDLVESVAKIVKANFLNRAADTSKTSERIGGYGYTRGGESGGTAYSNDVLATLSLYKRAVLL